MDHKTTRKSDYRLKMSDKELFMCTICKRRHVILELRRTRGLVFLMYLLVIMTTDVSVFANLQQTQPEEYPSGLSGD